MLNLYYKIWVDCITKIKNFDSFWWEYKSMMIMSFAMGVAYMVIMTIFENYILGFVFYEVNLENYFPKPLDDLLECLVLFFLPFIIINYFLIFFKKRYKILIQKYEYKNGKYFFTFFILCLALPILSFLAIILFK